MKLSLLINHFGKFQVTFLFIFCCCRCRCRCRCRQLFVLISVSVCRLASHRKTRPFFYSCPSLLYMQNTSIFCAVISTGIINYQSAHISQRHRRCRCVCQGKRQTVLGPNLNASTWQSTPRKRAPASGAAVADSCLRVKRKGIWKKKGCGNWTPLIIWINAGRRQGVTRIIVNWSKSWLTAFHRLETCTLLYTN